MHLDFIFYLHVPITIIREPILNIYTFVLYV